MVGGHVAGGLDGEAALFCEGQEQCFGDVNRSGVDEVEAVDELAVAAG